MNPAASPHSEATGFNPRGSSPISVFLRERWAWLALAAVLTAAAVLRVVDLGTRPANLTADELDDLQNVYQVLEGTAGGFFGLDWNQAPNFNMYLKAATVIVFGDTVAGARMYGVVLSLATLALFYPLARRRLAPLPSLLAVFLLATSLWFLHFSRTPWVAMSATLAAVLTAYLLDLALEKRNLRLFALLGVTLAFGAYGYFAGRTLVPIVGASFLVALLLREANALTLIRGFALSGVVALILVVPQVNTQIENWDYANTRPRAVSIFSVEGEYLGDDSKLEIAAHQTLRMVRGFILLDSGVVNYGLWARHRPEDWAFIDRATGVLYWLGLGAGVYYWRRFVYWWVFLLVPLFITQVFSTGTPDGSRGLMAAPFMFLFVGLGLETVLSPAGGRWRLALSGAVVALAVAIGAFNVDRYFNWIQERGALVARAPSVEVSEFVYWKELVRDYAEQDRLLSYEAWLRYRETVLGLPGRP